MITHENLKEVIKQITEKDRNRIQYTFKEYTVLILHIFNTGTRLEVKLTDDYNRWYKVTRDGNAILPTEEVKELINTK